MKYLGLFIIGLFVWSASAEETVIKGDSMELVDKGEMILFKGRVVLERGTDILKAKRMETSKRRDKVRADGNVELYRNLPSGEKLKAYGEQGFFDTETGDGYLLRGGKPSHVIYNQVVSSTQTRVLDVFADRFDFSQSNSTGLATGNVVGATTDPANNDRYQFWSNAAAINQASQTMKLTGAQRSKLRQDNAEGFRIVEGDVITYNADRRTLFAEGNARAVFIETQSKKEGSDGAHRP